MPPLLRVSVGVPVTVTGAVISTVSVILSPENSVPLPGDAATFVTVVAGTTFTTSGAEAALVTPETMSVAVKL